jgi:hypothetical protein
VDVLSCLNFYGFDNGAGVPKIDNGTGGGGSYLADV